MQIESEGWKEYTLDDRGKYLNGRVRLEKRRDPSLHLVKEVSVKSNGTLPWLYNLPSRCTED